MNKNSIIGKLKIVSYIIFFLSFISCRNSDHNDFNNEKKGGISFNIIYKDFNTVNTTASVKNNIDEFPLIAESSIISGPMNITAELKAIQSPDKSTKSRIVSTIKYRVVVYEQDGTYIGQETGDTSVPNQKLFENLNLVGNRKYTFVTYSLGGTRDIPVAPKDNLSSATLNITDLDGKEAGSDLMYAINEGVLLTGGNTVVNIVLKHQFSKIIISIDDSDATNTLKGGYSLNSNKTGGATGIISDFYTSANVKLKDGSPTGGISENLSVNGITTSEQTLIINTGGEKAYRTTITLPTGAVSIGKDINTSPISIAINGPTPDVPQTGIEYGKSYSLKLKFNSDRYTDEDGVTTTKENGKYAVIGGYRWARYNLGVTGDNPKVYDPDFLSEEVHGAKYQWGAKTGEKGRYISQQEDLVNANSITGWNTTALPDQSWSQGTSASPIRTERDPCIALDSGKYIYRVPTAREFQTLINTTIYKDSGIINSASFGVSLTSKKDKNILLTFPAAGFRDSSSGSLSKRGSYLYYWSSTEYSSNLAFYLNRNEISGNMAVYQFFRTSAYPIRCIQN